MFNRPGFWSHILVSLTVLQEMFTQQARFLLSDSGESDSPAGSVQQPSFCSQILVSLTVLQEVSVLQARFPLSDSGESDSPTGSLH